LVVKPRTPILATAVLLTVVGGAWQRDASAQALQNALQNAQATFADAPGDKIRSDGLGTYWDDSLDPNSCVRSYVVTNPTGKAFMRTGQHPEQCVLPPGAPARELVLDFSDPVAGFPVPCTYAAGTGALDACGFNSIPDDLNSVSRRHARLVVTDGVARLEDLGSKNGTVLNSERITSAVPLANRDRIKIGAASLVFRCSRRLGTTESEMSP
jgi:hypothetical protein